MNRSLVYINYSDDEIIYLYCKGEEFYDPYYLIKEIECRDIEDNAIKARRECLREVERDNQYKKIFSLLLGVIFIGCSMFQMFFSW